jgi:hypothetical protein
MTDDRQESESEYEHEWVYPAGGENNWCRNCRALEPPNDRKGRSRNYRVRIDARCPGLIMKALAAKDAELDLIRKLANAEVEIGVALSEDVTETVEAVCGLLDRLNEGDSKTEVPRRRKLPNRRRGYTQKVKINGESVFLRVSEYEDGAVGEIFVNMYKQGAGFGAMLNAFCVAISVGLQYGVPLEKFVDLFIYSRFQPDGFVAGHDQINRCSSAIDFIFQDLALTFLGDDAIKKRPSTNPIDSE